MTDSLENKTWEIPIDTQALFDLITGTKRVDAWLCRGIWSEMKIGDKVIFYLENNSRYLFNIISMKKYKTFKEMLIAESIDRVLPNKNSIREALNYYFKPQGLYTLDEEKEFGVIAVRLVSMRAVD